MINAFVPHIFATESNDFSSDTQDSENIFTIDAKSAVLMEAQTGTVLYSYHADDELPPASVTKVMTLLLVMEAIDGHKISLDDLVTVSERASSMGGSQIYLEVGEQMTVEDLIKSVVMASANDAALALAEYIAGSEEEFVRKMNERASELGMNHTHFENTNGLDDTTENHVTSALDIAIMSAELLKHKSILNYTTLWQDTVRNGSFTLTNTNRLVRFYAGCTGLKTGSTSKAGFCISATAERNGMQLIAVIMGSSSRDNRNAAAKKLLDFGFANYTLYAAPKSNLDPITIVHGQTTSVSVAYTDFYQVLSKDESDISVKYDLPTELEAPVSKGEKVGEISYYCRNVLIGKSYIYALEEVKRIGYWDLLGRILKKYLLIS
jgi:D-alanyl-D-alanine carboxypeptidase (penicillin-binding protein 5/6)